MIYVSSDLHLNHNRGFVYELRGFSSIEEMNETIIKNFNEVITSEDDLYLLGDNFLGELEPGIELFKQIPGKIHLIWGNHDTDTRKAALSKCSNVVEICGFATIIHPSKWHLFCSHFPANTTNFDDYKKKIKELSKGNQQKVQFISAIINEPKLLILDEPFSGLDPLNVELFKKIILELKKKGTSIIFSSHRMEHVELFCEELVVLVKGKSVLQGKLSDIKKKYKKKNLFVIGDIDIDEITKLEGVEKIDKINNEYIISISDESYIKPLFKKISKYDNILKFSVEDPSLNEIFISIVGDNYE